MLTKNVIPTETETLTSIVSRVMRIDSVTLGDPKQRYLVRYQGQIYGEDTSSAYDQLSGALRSLEITPLFRMEGGRQTVILVPGVIKPTTSRAWINVLLFALTALSVLFIGTISYNTMDTSGITTLTPEVVLKLIIGGLPYAASLLAILLCHEFGHYLVSRYHKTAASLPYFIPLPFPPLGTMGAVIFQKDAHKNRNILLDIGMAGPLAGFIVAIPILLLGLALSHVEPIPAVIPSGMQFQLEGNSLLYLLAKFIFFHQLLPAPASYGGLSPILYWVRYFFTGQPLPLGGMDVMIHPVAFAGWAGLLVTALNLIPAGQLDGGHIIHSLLGDRSRALLPIILSALVLLGLVWQGWWLWALLIFFLGRAYAEPLDQITPVSAGRRALAVICVLIFLAVFTPVPLTFVLGR